MTDFEAMYFKLFRATEEAIRILVSAQKEVEEMYISSETPELTVLSRLKGDK
ncbi:MAG: hypothetical protein RSF77_04035 [Oscillospiraceae bacterium]